MFCKLLILFLTFYYLSAHPRAIPRAVRIVAGQDESIDNAPWQVSLQHNSGHMCGGIIYNERIIITAAHCVRIEFPINMTVRVGSTYYNSGGTIFQMDSYMLHEKFDTIYLNNDVAVIKLNSSIDLSAKSPAKSIALANKSPLHGSPATVTGWGVTSKGSISTMLQKLNLSIVDYKACRESYGKYVTPDMICAVAPGKSACYGYSGGPLVVDNKLVGIVSWGVDCTHPRYPGVYSDVAYLRDWIIKATKKLLRYQLPN